MEIYMETYNKNWLLWNPFVHKMFDSLKLFAMAAESSKLVQCLAILCHIKKFLASFSLDHLRFW